MKVKPSIKKICNNCQIVKREGRLFVMCKKIQNINNDKVELSEA